MYNGPIRGGSRGGRDQFNWESVKGDKDREFYIGHSVKASVGRWQKGKDILWYTRAKQSNASSLVDERKAVKDREEELMLEALGIKKKASRELEPGGGSRKLEGYELDELLRKGSGEDAGGQANVQDEDVVKGLGFRPGNSWGVAVHEVLEGVDDGGEAVKRRRILEEGQSGLERGGKMGVSEKKEEVNFEQGKGEKKKKEKRKKEKKEKKEKKKEKKEKRKRMKEDREKEDHNEDRKRSHREVREKGEEIKAEGRDERWRGERTLPRGHHGHGQGSERDEMNRVVRDSERYTVGHRDSRTGEKEYRRGDRYVSSERDRRRDTRHKKDTLEVKHRRRKSQDTAEVLSDDSWEKMGKGSHAKSGTRHKTRRH